MVAKEDLVYKEKGMDCVAPCYTHLDKDGKPSGVLVNRGWLASDLQNMKLDKNTGMGNIYGVLYRGDPNTKDSKKNLPIYDQFYSVRPEELSILYQLPNEEEAGKFMVKQIDFDEDNRTVHPTIPSPSELSKFVIPPERHEAYEKMWNAMIYFGVVANTWVWLYM